MKNYDRPQCVKCGAYGHNSSKCRTFENDPDLVGGSVMVVSGSNKRIKKVIPKGGHDLVILDETTELFSVGYEYYGTFRRA